MRHIVLDTNILVSAAINLDAPHQLVMDWILTEKVRLATCSAVTHEYLDVLTRSKFTRYNFPPPWLRLLIQQGQQYPDHGPWPYPLPDVSDAPFLALAHAANAWLVTGNMKHFPESARGGVTVCSPAEYLQRLGSGS